jgi:hypothetical protein
LEPLPMPSADPGWTQADLEAVYDLLAHAIDEAGPDQVEKFLVKLALLNAQALGNAQRFGELIQVALRDL